jgi:hypothetical protein
MIPHPPPDAHILISGTYKHIVTWQRRIKVAEELRLLSTDFEMARLAWIFLVAQCIHKGPWMWKKEREESWSERFKVKNTQPTIAVLGNDQGLWAACRSCKRKWFLCFLEPAERTQPCQHQRDFSLPRTIISGLWPPELSCNKCLLF